MAENGRYRKRPLVVDAYRWDGHWSGFFQWALGMMRPLRGPDLLPIFKVSDANPALLEVRTLHGVTQAKPGEWVICGPDGDFWPCDREVFERFYEPVDATPKSKRG